MQNRSDWTLLAVIFVRRRGARARRSGSLPHPRAMSIIISPACPAGPRTSSKPSTTATARCCAARAGKFYLRAPGEVSMGLLRALRATDLGGRQADLVLRQGSRAGERAQHGRDAREHAGDAPVGNRLGEQPIRHQGAARRRRVALVSAHTQAPEHAISSWCASVSTRTASSPRCSSRTSSIRSRS